MVLASYVVALLSILRRADDGQDLVEYGLIVMLVSIVSIAVMLVLGSTINVLYTTITAAL